MLQFEINAQSMYTRDSDIDDILSENPYTCYFFEIFNYTLPLAEFRGRQKHLHYTHPCVNPEHKFDQLF